MNHKTTIVFQTEEELRALDRIKALTFCRSGKTAILRMVESYDAIVRECSELRMQRPREK